jgi:hypothetical protein
LKSKLEVLKLEKENITESLQALKKDLEEMRNTTETEAYRYEDQIHYLKQTIKNLEKDYKEEIETLSNKLTMANEENHIMHREMKKLRDELKASQEEVIRLEERLKLQVEQNEKLASDADHAAIQKERLLETITEANAQILNLKQKEEELLKLQIKEQDYLAKVANKSLVF